MMTVSGSTQIGLLKQGKQLLKIKDGKVLFYDRERRTVELWQENLAYIGSDGLNIEGATYEYFSDLCFLN